LTSLQSPHTMSVMEDKQIEPSAWNHCRGEVEQVLGKHLDEESWYVLQSLPVAVGSELLWHLRAFHPQLPTTGGTISFHPIRSLPSTGAEDQVCPLCGGPLPQVLTAQATQRFHCELCAISMRLLLDYPILYERSLEALSASER
jgi:hypothetical protein